MAQSAQPLSLSDQPPATAESTVRTCDTRDGLAAIAEAELVIWQRPLGAIGDWLEGLDAALLPDFRILVAPGDLRRAMAPLLEQAGLPAGDSREALVADIQGLVDAYASITGSDLVDVRLERVTGDACWKFHRDMVETRLVTSYRGPSTEWVHPGDSEQALAEQRDYAGPMERLGSGDVAIFKGAKAGAANGIVHRSPSIAGSGVTRLLLCLNRPSFASPEPWGANSV